jgi:hypothetical protein
MPPTIESGPDDDVTLFAGCEEAPRSRAITISADLPSCRKTHKVHLQNQRRVGERRWLTIPRGDRAGSHHSNIITGVSRT